MQTTFRSFDENGDMIYGGRACKGKKGVVSAGRAEAAAIGQEILNQGGNAIDAAVATAFALGVCEPNASGIGGGGFLTVRDGATGAVKVLDFSIAASTHLDPAAYPLDGSAEDGAWFKWPRVNDAMRELEIACDMDPGNMEYQKAKQMFNSSSRGYGSTYYGNGEPPRRSTTTDDVCDLCIKIKMLDCLCECMGGDLIRCC